MLYLVSSKGFLPLLLRFVTFYSLNFFNATLTWSSDLAAWRAYPTLPSATYRSYT